MDTDLDAWVAAWRHSHDTLAALVADLDAGELEGRSYCSEWSVAQVLSHLGSQAEIFGLFLDAGLSGGPAPSRDAYFPIWDRWNARGPEEQATESVQTNEAVITRTESLTPDERGRLHLELFGRSMDAVGLVRMRLGEHAVHAWDVAVALDPSATVAADSVGLLVDTVPQLVGRAAKPDGSRQRVQVVTRDPERRFTLDVGDAVTIEPAAAGGDGPELRLPAEALLRLAYGRLDAEHTPPLDADGVDLDALRRVFPGF